MNKKSNIFSSRAFKSGSYAAVLCAIAVAICVCVNILVGALPNKYKTIDLSGTGIFSLSDESQNLVSNLKTDVNIYYLAETGYEDPAITNLLDKYESISSKVKVEYKDPVLYPTFAAYYDAQGASTGSLIVTNGTKHRLVSTNELYEQTPNYTTYTYDTSFAGEARITSAISYVSKENATKIYTLTGHGEAELSQEATTALSRKNYDSAELNLLTQGTVPEDAGALVIFEPQKDISKEELTALQAYLSEGGSLLLSNNLNPNMQFTNLNALLEEFGLTSDSGIIVEGDANAHLNNYPHYLLPAIGIHAITEPLIENSNFVLMPMAFAIKETDQLPEGVTITPLLTSSSKSYLKASGYEAQTLEKEENDLQGPFNVGVLSQKTAGDKVGSVVWFSSSGILDEVSNSIVSGSNLDMFTNSLSFLSGSEEDISLSAKAISTPTITVPAQTVNLLTALTIVIIPLALIILGAVIWVKRRRA